MPVQTPTAPTVVDGTAQFTVTDPEHTYTGVRLWQELHLPGKLLDFRRTGDGWALSVQLPAVQRMEYLLELQHADGGTETVVDPANRLTVDGAFGPHSVLELPSYTAPGWLTAPRTAGLWSTLTVPSVTLRDDVDVRLWAPALMVAEQPLPLMVAHDGPEYEQLSSLSSYSAAMITAGRLPPHRLALMSPADRDEWYSASPSYATALTLAVLPTIRAAVAVRGRPVGMGASLGGLAMLHAQRRRPRTFAGLFLQSASFFHPRFDGHESRFARYGRISRYVQTVLRASGSRDPVPIAMTCGELEENMSNNRLMARGLRAQGYDVTLTEVPDVHSYTAWRDAFDPVLTDLLRLLWTVART